MSTPRLILKQPTGWFAAGREFAQAITLLSDGAFKLYVYACLHAGRHTGCLRATVEELARAVETTPSVIAMHVDELEERAVCCVRRDRVRRESARPVPGPSLRSGQLLSRR